jgi:amino acid permease
MIVSFNVGYDDPMLASYDGISGTISSDNSPFIIAMKRSTLSRSFATAYKAFFFFSAATTA